MKCVKNNFYLLRNKIIVSPDSSMRGKKTDSHCVNFNTRGGPCSLSLLPGICQEEICFHLTQQRH